MPEKENSEALSETDCPETESVHRIGTEQLKLWLGDGRNEAQETRRALLRAVDMLDRQIAAYDQLLAELTN